MGDPVEVKRSLSLTNDASVSKKYDFVPTVIERSKSFSLPWTTNPASAMTHETEVRKRNSSGPVCVQRQPRIGGKSLFTDMRRLIETLIRNMSLLKIQNLHNDILMSWSFC